jgi:hypothetical protein
MGQLESLRKLNIVESKIKERRKEKYAIAVHYDRTFSES